MPQRRVAARATAMCAAPPVRSTMPSSMDPASPAPRRPAGPDAGPANDNHDVSPGTDAPALVTPAAPDLPATTPSGPPPAPPAREFYLNRELTWINFAWRVAGEAVDTRNPLLERLKFVAIVGSTLDEFVMKRLGGLKLQVDAGVVDKTVDGRTPSEQVRQCQAALRDLDVHIHQVLTELRAELAEHGIEIVPWTKLDPAEQRQLRQYYVDNIFPLVTPQAMDPAHPFPFISNLSLNLLVTPAATPRSTRELLARVKVPVGDRASRSPAAGARPVGALRAARSRSWPRTSICCSPAWTSRDLRSPSGSPATPTPRATRIRPTICWR